MTDTSSDPFDLSRFVEAQSAVYATALAEIKAGEKRSHWMWFIFPQLEGLGTSRMARRFAIRTRAEARAYLEHPLLGPRLRECVGALLMVEGRSAEQMMGDPDFLKLQSSMTLFMGVSPDESSFERLLEKYYSGGKDQRTLDYLFREGARFKKVESPEFTMTVERLLTELEPEDCESIAEYHDAKELHALPLGLDMWSQMFLTPDGEIIWVGGEPLEIRRSRYEGHLCAALRMAAERFPDMEKFVVTHENAA
jgi:uncharacterized protein (DUF1810 family)